MNNEDKYVMRGDSSLELSLNSTDSSLYECVQDSSNAPYGDLTRKTNEFLDRVRLEASNIVSEARRDANEVRNAAIAEIRRERDALEKRASELENARLTLEADLKTLEERQLRLENESFEGACKEGYEKGYAEGTEKGFEEGLKKANEEIDARVIESAKNKVNEARDSELVPLRKLVQEMRGARQALLKNWEENLMQIAAAIAYQAILREPTIMREAPLDLLREALELAMNCASLKIRMNPVDVEELKEQIQVVLEESGNLAKTELVADPKITRGGCLVETSLGVVDERLESRLERIVAELSE